MFVNKRQTFKAFVHLFMVVRANNCLSLTVNLTGASKMVDVTVAACASYKM